MIRSYHILSGDPIANIPGWPFVVVEDDDEVVVLYLPEGSPVTRWNIEERSFREPRLTQGDSLWLLYPGKRYHVSLMFETGSGPAPHVKYYFPEGSGPFYGWKIDLDAPFRRTEVGFDLFDEVLDIVVHPDRSYYWKDEDQMQRLIAAGVYTPDLAGELRGVGEEVIKLVEAGASPFDSRWSSWRPTPDLHLSKMPEGWPDAPTPGMPEG